MGQKLGSTLLVVGAFLLLLGISFVPAALLQHHDETILGAGICAISFGALSCAAGFYLKARAFESSARPGSAALHKVRGGCDLCRGEAPVVHCRVHQLHICGTCLATHYDFRSCVYIPSTRRGASTRLTARAAKA